MNEPTPTSWEPPTIIDEFRLLRPLGRGAMGQVFVGHDTLLDRLVAVKFLVGQPDELARQRFTNEARAIARLQHPNVVSIYRVGECAGHPFLVSELVRGEPLNALALPLSPAQVLAIAIDAAGGLAAAHQQGVLHRDVKPANMVRTAEGQVKLLDFGLAYLDGESAAGRAGLARTLTSVESEPTTSVGTPLYMAPEVRAGQPGTGRSDIYSLGCVLFELCTGTAPLRLRVGAVVTPAALLSQTQDEEDDAAPNPLSPSDFAPPPLAQLCPDTAAPTSGALSLGAIVDRCLRPDPAERYPDAQALCDDLLSLRAGALAERAPRPSGNPYRGLLPFGSEHRAVFFGRRAETESVVERLRAASLLLIAGGSGVGKSSLCRAGVLPRVQEGALFGERAVQVISVIPSRQPLRSLCAALASLLGSEETALRERLRGEPAALAQTLRRTSSAAPVLVYIDQLEEIFTCESPAEIASFGEVLSYFTDLGPYARALCTVRADFLPRLLALPGLGREVARALFLLAPLSAGCVREAILLPAHALGVTFESEALVTTLIGSALSMPGGLPLLQFALAQLWERQAQGDPVITDQALKAMGGVAGALARHADGVLSGLDQAGQDAARRVLQRLASPDGKRLRCSHAELCQDDAAAETVLEELVRGRLIAASGSGADTAYEIAHDAFLSDWERLRGWLDRGAQGRAALQRIEAAAAEWERLESSPQALWREQQLAEVKDVSTADLRPREAAFLRAAQRASRQRRWRRGAAVLLLPMLLLSLVGATRWATSRAVARAVTDRLRDANATLTQARAAHHHSLHLREAAQAGFHAAAAQADTAEAQWSQSLLLRAAEDRAYSEAIDQLEAALLLDTRREDVHDLLADVLHERAALLDDERRPELTGDIQRRLALHDRGGQRLQRLREPAVLEIRSVPAGAALTLQRYQSDGARLRLEPPAQRGNAPQRFNVAAGSWLLVLTHEGRVTVRMPLLVRRGARLDLALVLPPTSAVPPGYLYVPPGEFLYGSDEDEDLRRGFFNTQPLFPRRTGAYLIGRTEVTFGEWIEFLRALPAEERRARLPHGQGQGAVQLLEQPGGGFRLSWRFLSFVRSASEGEPMRYPQRERRAQQDWSRWPVSGLSFEDAQAYVAWLQRSGRLPAARLCDEREWERAARGADGRRFPHGNQLLPDDANFSETYGRRPTTFGPDEVGAHPASQSPFGAEDMAGNVWELTTAARNPKQSVFRGGGWYYERLVSRACNRESVDGAPPRDVLVGLRICATYPPGAAEQRPDGSP